MRAQAAVVQRPPSCSLPARLLTWLYVNKWEILLVLLLTGIGAFLRIYRVGELPDGLHGDEALTGLDALRITRDGWIGPYVGSALGQPSGPLYFTALVFWLSDATLFTLRLSMAVLGAATIPAAYLLFRLNFGFWIATFATVALTFSYWHLHFSRTAFMVISMPLMISLSSLALLWAFKTPRLLPWLLSGLLLGAGVYSYNGYPMFLATVALVLAVYLLVNKAQWRRLAVRYGLLALGSLVIVLPMIQFILNDPDHYLSHARSASIVHDDNFTKLEGTRDKLAFVGERLRTSFGLLISYSEIDGVDGSGGRGTLAPVIAVLAYTGLGISLLRWRDPRYLLAATTVIAALCMPVLTTNYAGELRRSLIAVPFVFALAGIASVDIVRVCTRCLGNAGFRAASGMAAASLVACAAWNVWYYFDHAVERQQTEWVFGNTLVESLQVLDEIDNPGTVYFYSNRWSYNYPTRKYLLPDAEGVDRSNEFGEFTLRRADAGPVTYVLMARYMEEIDRLRQLYPDGRLLEARDDKGKLDAIVYHLS